MILCVLTLAPSLSLLCLLKRQSTLSTIYHLPLPSTITSLSLVPSLPLTHTKLCGHPSHSPTQLAHPCNSPSPQLLSLYSVLSVALHQSTPASSSFFVFAISIFSPFSHPIHISSLVTPHLVPPPPSRDTAIRLASIHHPPKLPSIRSPSALSRLIISFRFGFHFFWF